MQVHQRRPSARWSRCRCSSGTRWEASPLQHANVSVESSDCEGCSPRFSSWDTRRYVPPLYMLKLPVCVTLCVSPIRQEENCEAIFITCVPVYINKADVLFLALCSSWVVLQICKCWYLNQNLNLWQQQQNAAETVRLTAGKRLTSKTRSIVTAVKGCNGLGFNHGGQSKCSSKALYGNQRVTIVLCMNMKK